jgi:hypothetical protein
MRHDADSFGIARAFKEFLRVLPGNHAVPLAVHEEKQFSITCQQSSVGLGYNRMVGSI